MSHLEDALDQLGMAEARLLGSATCPLCGAETSAHKKWAKDIHAVAEALGGAVQTEAPKRKSAVACLKSASYLTHRAAVEGAPEDRETRMDLMKQINAIRDLLRGH